MKNEKIKILMVVEQCNPEWTSVPLLSYNFYHEIRKRARITLVTHERNQSALEKVQGEHTIDYIRESSLLKRYYRFIKIVTDRGAVNWPLQHALSYPIYAEFNHRVSQKYGPLIRSGEYDLVHVMTPILPRYPVKLINHCKNTPFLLGPVNGGVPFPPGFDTVAKKEFAEFNFLRMFTRLIPGYRKTYQTADKALSGSLYTQNMLMNLFDMDDNRIDLFHENGILESFIGTAKKHTSKTMKLLFVGRLVAYKGADMAIKAISTLPESVQKRLTFTIVGDGPEKNSLEKLTRTTGVEELVHFTGWIPQKETLTHYTQSDVFCFPSVREFGGAVALEAMGCGLPCIVPDYAGLGEYVTEETGIKIEPKSREYLVQQFAEKIQFLLEHPEIREKMSARAIDRVKSYEWGHKADDMVALYKKMIHA
ncbi:MAG: glycosyltransferase family 4 protein [Desulfobacterium sp.]